MELETCLPANLRGPHTTITRITEGWSGAGVYRVEADGQKFVLKITDAGEALEDWHRKVHLLQLAAQAELAPRVIHVDEARRAVVSVFIEDRSFPVFYYNPPTREAALEQLGRLLRRVHELPLPPDAEPKDPRDILGHLWSGLQNFPLPAFVDDAVQRVRDEIRPDCDRAPVLSHNDVNPSNLVFDGARVLLLDWDVASANDPLYDLAAAAVFFRMDEATCLKLLAIHDGAAIAALPARFLYNRRVIAALCGAAFLFFARRAGYAGAKGETLESTPTFGEFAHRMRAGTVNLTKPEGQWDLGLSLLKTSLGL